MESFSVHEAKTHLSRLLKKVQAGEEIIITSSGRPVAKLSAPPKKKKRILGDLEGQPYYIAPDFDEPMPDEWFDDPEDPLNKP
jgi:antitoxin (DNA-binding transcriptional repressor) of toxin-antitoxin stability system